MATIHTSVPEGLLDLLTSRLPSSLPLLRRLQFTRFPGGQRPTARIIVALEYPDTSHHHDHGHDCDQSHQSGQQQQQQYRHQNFAAAYLDFGSGIETQLYMYSTLEDANLLNNTTTTDTDTATSADKREVCETQILAVLDAVRRVGRDQQQQQQQQKQQHQHQQQHQQHQHQHQQNQPPRISVLVGTLATAVRDAMMARGVRVAPRAAYEYEKWLFRADEMPDPELEGGVVADLPAGARWEAAGERDCEVVVSRTEIPRQVKTLMTLPSLVLKLEDGTPIAWSFLGTDGSLSSLHCEPPYRKRGYATLLAAKLFKRSTAAYGPDGWCSADVAPDNVGSRGVCRSLGGRHAWNCSWNIIHLDE